MKVKIEAGGVSFIPYNVLSAERAMAVANRAPTKNDDGVFYYTYHCTAENGIKKDIRDWDKIEPGEYDLPDKDWQIPDSTEEDDSWLEDA